MEKGIFIFNMNTPKGFRLHIGIYGRRNVGKSSLINAITKQNVSIVSPIAGTTTDPVEKPMELLPIGPVLFIDTAGIDDIGEVGTKRVEKTLACIKRTDLAIIVTYGNMWDDFENFLVKEMKKYKIPIIVVFNKSDEIEPDPKILEYISSEKLPTIITSTITGKGINELKEAIINNAPEDFFSSHKIISDIVPSGETVVLVIPIDKEAPKGRIILPQVQTLRELLDHGCTSVVCRDSELEVTLSNLKKIPYLVVTDSQAFKKVASIVPENILLTGFSILYARCKGDLKSMLLNTFEIDKLKNGDKILIAEACTHHPIGEDIGRVKIPKLLKEYTKANLDFKVFSGHDFPEDLSSYRLVIHCGACMHNRREVINRIMKCAEANVPITNYGLVIAFTLGIFERALKPFPEYKIYVDYIKKIS